jgi:hypothetical protein
MRCSHTCVIAGVVAGVMIAVPGCLGSPRTHAELEHGDQSVRFEGMVERADVPVVVESFDYQAQRWVPLSRIEQFARTVDPLGTHYRFAADVLLPANRAHWAPGPARRSMRTQLRALQGAHTLASFDADADACLRRAQLDVDPRHPQEALHSSLRRCQASGSPAVELVLRRCGGLAESCCDYHGASELELCAPDLACTQRRCTPPRYPVPLVAGHTQDLSAPTGARLREAWLELDDRSAGADTRISLIAKHVPMPGVTLERPQADVVRLRFDLPLWQPGQNRHRVVALFESGDDVHERSTPFSGLRYEPTPGLGFDRQGRFQLPARHFPRTLQDCRGLGCKDADGDGLSDLWENVALHQLRPRLMLDQDDSLFSTKDAVRVISSVVPLRRNDRDYVLFAHVVTFSRDYGPPVLHSLLGFDHAGDTEAIGMAFAVEPDGALRWAASVAKGHTCLTCKPSWHWYPQDFDRDGAPLVYVEQDKHGLWQNAVECRARAAFSCGGERALRPQIINAGDLRAGGTATLVDALDRVTPDGPHAALAQVFPGEALWSHERARVSGRFCGGHSKGCTRARSARIPGDVIGSVMRRFAQDRW